MLSGEVEWIRTLPPRRSTSIASSLAAGRESGSARASRRACVRKACGVCTAQSPDRSSVRWTCPPSPARLIVSLTGVAAITPAALSSAASSSTSASIRPGVTSGRAASWTTTISPMQSESALATDSERCSPPATATRPRPETNSWWPGGAATTISPIVLAARKASSDHSISGRPAISTKAFGPPAPSRCPEPAAAITADAEGPASLGGRLCGAEALLQQLVQVGLRPVLVLVEGVHELRGEDLLGAGVHLLLAGGESLLPFADVEVANHLGELVDVARLDLLAIVLEAAVPVLRHLGDLVGEDPDHPLDLLLVDHAPQSRKAGVLAGDHHGHIVVEDVDGQVVPLLSHQVPRLLLQDHARTMVRIDDVVADLKVNDRRLDLEVGNRRLVDDLLCYQLWNWSLLSSRRPDTAVSSVGSGRPDRPPQACAGPRGCPWRARRPHPRPPRGRRRWRPGPRRARRTPG